jgi:hypothetical protein
MGSSSFSDRRIFIALSMVTGSDQLGRAGEQHDGAPRSPSLPLLLVRITEMRRLRRGVDPLL